MELKVELESMKSNLESKLTIDPLLSKLCSHLSPQFSP